MSDAKTHAGQVVASTFEQALDNELSGIRELLIKKHLDYGTSNILVFGERGVLVRVSDKLARIKNCIWDSSSLKNESVDDSWIDIIGYGLLARMLRNGTYTLPMNQAIPSNEINEEDLEHRCAIHHTRMYIVRPGQWACNECENEWFAEEIKNKGTAMR